MLLLLCFAVLAAQTALAQEPPPEARLNYGVIFQNAGRMAVATQKWLHTFELVFPRYQHEDIPKADCTGVNHPNCNLHSMFVTAINKLSEDLERDVVDAYARAQSVLRTRLNVGPVDVDRLDEVGTQTDDSELRSRSRRSLLPYVDDLASELFGVATQSEIETLASHIRKIYRMQNRALEGRRVHADQLVGFMQKTNARLLNTVEAMKENHKFVQILQSSIESMGKEFGQMELETGTFTPVIIKKTLLLVRIESQLQQFLTGVHLLVQRQLSPALVPETTPREALKRTEKSLALKHPDFKVINRHPSYYYQSQDVLYSYHELSFFVTIQIPISSRSALFDIFRVLTFPVPLNHSTTHVTLIQILPDYIAMAEDHSAFVEMSSTEFGLCTQNLIRTCPTLKGQSSLQSPTCAAALFAKLSTRKRCNFRMIEDALKPLLFEVQPGLALLSNIQEVIITCRNQVRRKIGCQFCLMHIPCECTLLADNIQIAPRLTACMDEPDNSQSFPVNVALLEQFFNESTLAEINSHKVYSDPVVYSIPHLHIEDRSFEEALEKNARLDADLKHIVKKMKRAEKIYRNRPSITMEDLMDTSNDMSAWPHIVAVVSFGFFYPAIGGPINSFQALQELMSYCWSANRRCKTSC